MPFALSGATLRRTRASAVETLYATLPSAQDEVNMENVIDFHWVPGAGIFYPRHGSIQSPN